MEKEKKTTNTQTNKNTKQKKTQKKKIESNPIQYGSHIKDLMPGFIPGINKMTVHSVSQAWQLLEYTVTASSNMKETLNWEGEGKDNSLKKKS